MVAVLTRPASRAGRGRRLAPSPVAEVATDHGIEVLTPRRPAEPELLERLCVLAPDCAPVVAYGALLPPAALAVPAHGWVNLHFSLLPAWRGAAPVPAAIRHGDEVTGATTFAQEEGLDTGPVYGVLTEAIRPRDTAGELLDRLADAGARLLLATLDAIADGTLLAVPQIADGVSYAPKVSTADAEVDWTQPAPAVDRLVQACTPAPGAWTTWRGARLKLGPVLPVLPVLPVAPTVPVAGALPPGAVEVAGGAVLVGTATTPVALGEVQPAGRRMLPAVDWARGARPAGERLG